MTHRLPLLALACILFVACGGEKAGAEKTVAAPAAPTTTARRPPAAPVVRQIIADSAELSDFQFTDASWTLPMTKSAMNAPALANAKALAKAGWISFDGDGNVVLSERAKNDRRWLVRQNGFTDLVPLAKKELIDVNAVRTNHDGSIAADFGWKWQPNDLGSIFQSGPPAERFVALHEATATLIPDGDGWTVLRITAR